MKIFVLAPKENWICDRFVSEWVSAHPESSTTYLQEADIVWLLADWCWNHLPINVLQDKKVVASVHAQHFLAQTGSQLETTWT